MTEEMAGLGEVVVSGEVGAGSVAPVAASRTHAGKETGRDTTYDDTPETRSESGNETLSGVFGNDTSVISFWATAPSLLRGAL
jgi:hypothetical protein